MGEMSVTSKRTEDTRRNTARQAAEDRIQRILIDLDEEVGTISDVQVDTRNFSNLKVEIYLENEPS